MKEAILEALRSALLDRVALDSPPETVWKRTAVLNTWGTNAIEGNTLSFRDVQDVLLKGKSVPGKPLGDVLETVQHEAAFRGLLDLRPTAIRMTTALELHEQVFRLVKPDAGQWRRVNVQISGSSLVLPRMEKVVSLMEEWQREYAKREIDGEPVLHLAAWMHERFESIHPFSDGNGRVGRLLLNLHFLRHNWPPVHVFPSDRERYLHALEAARLEGHAPLVEFLRVQMGRSLVDLLDQVGTKADELRPLRSFEELGPYSAKYLGLRAKQAELPAVKVSGDWLTSARAVKLYRDVVGRAQKREEQTLASGNLQ